ncbi:MAG: TnpV protein [Oscillospiraceae bacterium]|nr:TnpV protein [Oscillospiraceae bacterium]
MDFELTYTKVGDYYIPDLMLDECLTTEKFYGKYGDLRRAYLQKHKPKLWMLLVNTGRADNHLTSIERAAERRMDTLLPELMKAAGVTEELKASNQMAWVRLVNNCQARAEEIICTELVYN